MDMYALDIVLIFPTAEMNQATHHTIAGNCIHIFTYSIYTTQHMYGGIVFTSKMCFPPKAIPFSTNVGTR